MYNDKQYETTWHYQVLLARAVLVEFRLPFCEFKKIENIYCSLNLFFSSLSNVFILLFEGKNMRYKHMRYKNLEGMDN